MATKSKSAKSSSASTAIPAPVYTFKDGTFITDTDLAQAKKEMTGYLLFLCYSHILVLDERVTPVIRKKDVFGKLYSTRTTSPDWMQTAARQQVRQIKPRLLRQVTDQQEMDWRLGKGDIESISYQARLQQIMAAMQPIAGRPDGWSLLGINEESELIELVRKCYGAKAAQAASKDNLFAYEMALQLLARKNKLAAAPLVANKILSAPKRKISKPRSGKSVLAKTSKKR